MMIMYSSNPRTLSIARNLGVGLSLAMLVFLALTVAARADERRANILTDIKPGMFQRKVRADSIPYPSPRRG